MTTEATGVEPGMYDIPAELYHSDPIPGGSLSSTGARKLATECPARFKHWLDNPEPHTAALEFGTAAHTVVLGNGPELVVVDADRWDTNETKAKVAAIREAGGVPLKPADYQRINDMAEALAANPEASDLLAPGSGLAEQSLFWPDGDVWRRVRIDWLRPDAIVDYKTSRSVDPQHLEKAVHEYGYHQQAEFYRDGAVELGLLPPGAAFKFIFQEKNPPYLVTVAEIDAFAREVGRQMNAGALHLYATCRATGHWPAYVEGTALIPLPAYVERQYA
ncbi:PD-(D/E)XK nuclease-like domain-containing protein [Streptomyces sp. SAJ15]|uniref:PD-(D/E)XK nuclease-like domain-containing protein n=1 Tax=Streptomyces sp. SAJ15 TaxID=2011095 RepID=UPI0021B20831|nr:PD-(D/E)XK nuclease-like domain-containing protein [Streptomyces sp. SAJ15]